VKYTSSSFTLVSLISGVSVHMPGFKSRPAHMGCAADKGELGQIFLSTSVSFC